jgi:hypothetical protein
MLDTNGRELSRNKINDVDFYTFGIINNKYLVFTKLVLTSGLMRLRPGEKFGKDSNMYYAIKILTVNGDSVKEFNLKQREKPYKDEILAGEGHNISGFDIDINNNIVVAYSAQNRIEKYSQDGDLILQISRNIGIKETDKTEKKDVIKNGQIVAQYGIFNRFSYDISVDGQNRIWVLSHIRQYTSNELSSMYKSRTDITRTLPQVIIHYILQFEVFDSRGYGCKELTLIKVIIQV